MILHTEFLPYKFQVYSIKFNSCKYFFSFFLFEMEQMN